MADQTLKRDYHAPLDAVKVYGHGAWMLTVGTILNGATWVVEYQSAASSRYQRLYFATKAEAIEDARNFLKPMKRVAA